MIARARTRRRIVACRWGLVSAVLLVVGAQAGEILKRHVDHSFRYAGDDVWEIVLHGSDGDPDLDPDETVMVLIDQPFPADGNRATRPPGEEWDFLGVGPGEDIWLIPQAFSPFLWPGWRSEGTFAEYFDDDPRLGFTAPFVKVSLEGVTYSGLGAGYFSSWEISGGVPQEWIASADGISEEDGYFFSSGHAHTNMGFSDPGVYRVDYRASAFLGNDGGNPPAGTNPVTSPVQSFYYSVGTYAEWKASYYEPHELVDGDPSDGVPEVAHYDSDTDQDGVSLLLEYAFNLIPVQKDAKTLVPGTGTEGLPVGYLDESGDDAKLVIEYVRRRAVGSPRLTYRPEFSCTLDSDWTEAASESVELIDETWERVRAMDSARADQARTRFGRVRIDLQ